MDMMNLTRLGRNRYEIRFKYKDPLTGHQKSIRRRLAGTLEEARTMRDQLKAAAKTGALGKEQSSGQTLRSYRSSYARARKVKRGWVATPGTRERDYFVLKDHILPEMGDWIVREIQISDLERVLDGWIKKTKPNGEKYAVSTVNQWIKIARLYIGYCAKMEGIDSPAEQLEYLAVPSRKTGMALTADQVSIFLDYVQERAPQWYAMCVIGFGTGLRFSSLSALRWDDIDRDKGVITVQRSQYRGVEKEGDKMGKIIRLPLLPAFDDALQRHRGWLIETSHPGLWTGKVFPSRKTDGVQNGFLSRSALGRVMRLASKALQREHPDFPPDQHARHAANIYYAQLRPAARPARNPGSGRPQPRPDHLSL